MKNLSPRQQEILELVAKKGFLSVEEIQREAGISQATTYRELQTLARLGLAARVPRGISQVEAPPSDQCIQCGKEINPRTVLLIKLKDGKDASACCPHCGFMAFESRTDVHTAMATDFFHGTRINARHATYVLGSDVNLCCHPSVLSFLNYKDAERFVKGFGGTVMNFVTAQAAINKLMEL
jgi:DNA-directed RNA polymerase subunit RPC12/RpoP